MDTSKRDSHHRCDEDAAAAVCPNTLSSSTLAFYASCGWLLTLYCLKCRAPKRTFTSRQIVETFGASLLATVDDVAARLVCTICPHKGGFHSGFADRDPWREIGGRQAKREDDINICQARDLFLRRLLAEAGRPLEIAGIVWASLEAEALAKGWKDWKPRAGSREGCPLSKAGRLQFAGAG